MKELHLIVSATFVVASTVLSATSRAAEPQGSPPPIAKVRQRAAERSTGAIRELGRRKDTTSVPLLTQLAGNGTPTEDELKISKWRPREDLLREHREATTAARMALTRMGVADYFPEFERGLSSSSVEWKVDCILALGYIGDKRSVRALIPLLDETQPPPRVPGKQPYAPYSFYAVQALTEALPDDAARIRARAKTMPSGGTLKSWKDWWKENQDRFK